MQMYSLSGRVPHLVHHVERAGLVETSLDVQFCSLLSAKDAVDKGEFRVGEVFIFNLGWTVGGVH